MHEPGDLFQLPPPFSTCIQVRTSSPCPQRASYILPSHVENGNPCYHPVSRVSSCTMRSAMGAYNSRQKTLSGERVSVFLSYTFFLSCLHLLPITLVSTRCLLPEIGEPFCMLPWASGTINHDHFLKNVPIRMDHLKDGVLLCFAQGGRIVRRCSCYGA